MVHGSNQCQYSIVFNCYQKIKSNQDLLYHDMLNLRHTPPTSILIYTLVIAKFVRCIRHSQDLPFYLSKRKVLKSGKVCIYTITRHLHQRSRPYIVQSYMLLLKTCVDISRSLVAISDRTDSKVHQTEYITCFFFGLIVQSAYLIPPPDQLQPAIHTKNPISQMHMRSWPWVPKVYHQMPGRSYMYVQYILPIASQVYMCLCAYVSISSYIQGRTDTYIYDLQLASQLAVIIKYRDTEQDNRRYMQLTRWK